MVLRRPYSPEIVQWLRKVVVSLSGKGVGEDQPRIDHEDPEGK